MSSFEVNKDFVLFSKSFYIKEVNGPNLLLLDIILSKGKSCINYHGISERVYSLLSSLIIYNNIDKYVKQHGKINATMMTAESLALGAYCLYT